MGAAVLDLKGTLTELRLSRLWVGLPPFIVRHFVWRFYNPSHRLLYYIAVTGEQEQYPPPPLRPPCFACLWL
jgi:hypothetical protein